MRKTLIRLSLLVVFLFSAVGFTASLVETQNQTVPDSSSEEVNRAESFFVNYELIKNEKGEVTQIRLRGKQKKFSIKTMVSEIKKDILSFQSRGQKDNGQNLSGEERLFGIDALTEAFGVEELSGWKDEDQRHMRYSLGELDHLNIDKVVSSKKFQNFVAKFEKKIKKTLLGANVMADLNDSSFFYKRAVAFKLTNWGIKLAQKIFDNIPGLNIASFIVKQAEKNIRERRTFQQNGILHYLENFSAAQLGMTETEAAKALSSIYESKISWLGYGSSKAAKADWLNFGEFNFNTVYSNCDNRLLDYKDNVQIMGSRLNFAFNIVTENNKANGKEALKMIVNLKDGRYMFNSKPSIAYIFKKPLKVEIQRRLIRLAQLGARFVTMPPIVRGGFDRFTNSMYVSQIKTEGALKAYFESRNMMEDSKRVVRQSINPFL